VILRVTLSQASIYVVQRHCMIRCFQSTGRFLKRASVFRCKYFYNTPTKWHQVSMYTARQCKSTWTYTLEIILMTYILLYFCYHSGKYNTNTQVINPWSVKKARWMLRYLCRTVKELLCQNCDR